MRFPLEVPAVFSWVDASGERQRKEGRIYDVSELGAFVLASDCPPAGARVSVKIFLAGVTDAPGALMEMQGRVLRVEQIRTEGRDGFAILSDRPVEDAGSTAGN
jgi:hypothetical protein